MIPTGSKENTYSFGLERSAGDQLYFAWEKNVLGGLPLKPIVRISAKLLEGYPMPQIVQATLLPFGDVIIHDGVVSPYQMCLEKNMLEQSKQIYLAAKADGMLHDRLWMGLRKGVSA